MPATTAIPIPVQIISAPSLSAGYDAFLARVSAPRCAFATRGREIVSPSQDLAYRPSEVTCRNFASRSELRADWHIARSIPQRRCTCSGVRRRPGISEYSARRRMTVLRTVVIGATFRRNQKIRCAVAGRLEGEQVSVAKEQPCRRDIREDLRVVMYPERNQRARKKHAECTLCSIDGRFARNVDAPQLRPASQVRLTRCDKV
jgi:hypothetical protein